MYITNVDEWIVYYVETDEGIEYRRSSTSCSWERRYGDSWEPVYLNEEEEVEVAFQGYVSDI